MDSFFEKIIDMPLFCNVKEDLDFLGGTEERSPPANAEDMGSSPALGRFRMPQSI